MKSIDSETYLRRGELGLECAMIGYRTAFIFLSLILIVTACVIRSPAPKIATQPISACKVELIILGAGQDAGAPQFGNPEDPAWQDDTLKLSASSIALIDHSTAERYLFDAAPQITQHLNRLDKMAPSNGVNAGISGVFLTHAHIGHYAGLMYLGREVAGTAGVPVFAMPRMSAFLRANGPWGQLVELNNIALQPLGDRVRIKLSERVSVTPYRVPHRDEYSETVGYIIETGDRSALYLPDIDSWQEWESAFDVRLDEMIARVDYAFLDATFFDDNELPGRDMSKIPHPRVMETMDALRDQSDEVKASVYFIHYNHTNPIRFPVSEETRTVLKRGFNIAREGARHCLSGA